MKKKWRQKVVRTCPTCTKRFHPFRAQHRFCSFVCGLRGRKGKTKKNRVAKPCAMCGSLVERKAFLVAKSNRFFCCRKCKDQFQRRQYAGKDNPNYKNAGARICIGCGKTFKSYNKERKFCGTGCANNKNHSHVLACVKMGLLTEKRCCEILRRKGYHCTLSSASRGAYDVVAISAKEILLIQVKFTISKYRIFQPKAIRALRSASCPLSPIIKKQLWTFLDGTGWKVKTI